MMDYEKRYPALKDTDKMPWGKYKGISLQDVDPRYLMWVYEESNAKATSPELWNYIHNSMDAIQMELKGK